MPHPIDWIDLAGGCPAWRGVLGLLVVVLAAGLAAPASGALTFGAFGSLAFAEADAIRGGCGADQFCAPDELADGHTFATASDIGLGALLAGAAVGSILLLVHLDGGSGVERRGATSSPWITPEGAGALAQGAF